MQHIFSRSVWAVTLFFFGFHTLYAQPGAEEAVGCHITHKRIAGISYTPEELAYARAALERSDTFDVIEYRIHLTVKDFQLSRLEGFTEVDFQPKMDGLNYLNLDLERLVVDSVLYRGAILPFTHVGPLLTLHFPDVLSTQDTHSVVVYYKGVPMTSASGFGGFYFESGYAYNLGIGIRDKPHNYGRAWFPCFDNFVERSTFEYHITHAGNHMAYCVGTYRGTEDLGNGLMRTSYRMEQPIPTYLSSVAVSDYSHIEFNHPGENGIIPVRLIARPADLNAFENSFQQIGEAIDVFEKWYGPYPFERVGYVITTRGAMEHPTNVAYPGSAIANGAPDNRLMAHELCHHWWGNIVTLSTSHNMWIKEGPAEYGAHLFTEYVEGEEAFRAQLKANALNVLRRAHFDDGGFLALSPMPEDKTYGTHTYRKGALVLHNLRGYMGDDDYKKGMRSILQNFAYDNIDAYQMRDHLSSSTGRDMTAFFQDWVFQPGYPTFEVDSMVVEEEGSLYALTLHLEQKLYGREPNAWFNQLPIQVELRNADFELLHTFTAEVGGQWPVVQVMASEVPAYVLLNPGQTLNLGFMGDQVRRAEAGNYFMTGAQMRFRYLSGEGEAHVYAEHHFAGADDFKVNNNGIRIGKKRHWKVKAAQIPAGIDYWVEIEYTVANSLDDDLVGVTEDSIILLWRPDPSADWIEHPNYLKRRLAANDGQGFMRIYDLLPGEYAFGNGEFLNTGTRRQGLAGNRIKAFPNPSADRVFIDLDHASLPAVTLRLIAPDGKLVRSRTADWEEGQSLSVDMSNCTPGVYQVECYTAEGSLLGTARVVRK
jgi:aminopeptidase N